MIFIKKMNIRKYVTEKEFETVWKKDGYSIVDDEKPNVIDSKNNKTLDDKKNNYEENEEEIRQRAKELGINNHHNMNLERLKERIAEALENQNND